MSYSGNKRTSYKLTELLAYKNINNMMPQQLVSFCIPDYGSSSTELINFGDQVQDIINIITTGDNPNDVVFRNTIKFYINTLSHTNYLEYLEKISELNFTSKSNVHHFINELLLCSMRCPISYKGFNLSDINPHKSVPEVCADIVKYFYQNPIKVDEDIKFKSEFLSLCHQYFTNFMDSTKLMDENNAHNADNYKGFMTVMGLLYARSLIPHGAIIQCINDIRNAVFVSKSEYNNKKVSTRTATECANLYKGYEHLINHIVHRLQKRIPELLEKLKEQKIPLQNMEKLIREINNNNKYINLVGNQLDDLIVGKKVSDFRELETSEDSQNSQNSHNSQNEHQFVSFSDFHKFMSLNDPDINKIILELCNKKYTELEKEYNEQKLSIIKVGELLDEIIKCHQEFVISNAKFMAIDSKNQYTVVMRNYVIIVHNNIGKSLNELLGKLSNEYKSDVKYEVLSSKE